MTGNVLTANFRGNRKIITDPLWQWDYGQILRFTGITLPQTFEVHFANTDERGEAKTMIGTDYEVLIPDEYLTIGRNIFVWIYLHTGEDDGETEYKAQIPINKRAMPADEPPTPQEQSAITQAIAALNSAVVDVQEAVEAADDARASAASAGASATAAAASEAGVAEDADRASAAATAAESAQTAAEAAQAGAETAQTGAESARDEAAQASAAQIAQINATGAAVLESIPADYSELSDSVSNLKSNLYPSVVRLDSITFDKNATVSPNGSYRWATPNIPEGAKVTFVNNCTVALTLNVQDANSTEQNITSNVSANGGSITFTAPFDIAYMRSWIGYASTYSVEVTYGFNEFSEVKTELGKVQDSIDAILPSILVKKLIFTKNGLNRSNGDYYTTETRIHSPLTLVRKGDILDVPRSLKFSVFYYNVSSGYVSNTYDTLGWLEGKYQIETDGLISVTLSKANDADFTASECYAINETVLLYSATVTKTYGIYFEAGHIETASDSNTWRVKGNDYFYLSWAYSKDLSTTRWKTAEKVGFYKGATIEIAPGYRFYILIYNSDDSVTLTQWYTEKYTFTNDCKARILLDTVETPKTVYTAWGDLSEIITIVNDPSVINAITSNTTENLNADMETSLVAMSRYNTLKSGNYNSATGYKKNFSFAVISDLHGSSDAFSRFIEYSNKKKKYFDVVMCLGDVVPVQPSNDVSWFPTAVAESEIPFFFTVGNHDISDTGLSGITQTEARTRYFNTIESKGWLESADFMGSGKCSWSKDFADYKIRVISLFEYGNSTTISTGAPNTYCRRWIDTDEMQWFADTLYSTPTGYSVIVLLHQMSNYPADFIDDKFTIDSSLRNTTVLQNIFLNTIDGNPIEEIVDAFINSTNISKTYNSIASFNLGKTATVAKDFSGRSESGKFICYVVGHTHGSYITKSKAFENQKTVCLPSGSENIYQRSYGDITYDASNRNMDNFYCLGFDTDRKVINVVQIGGHETIDMRKRDVTSIPY